MIVGRHTPALTFNTPGLPAVPPVTLMVHETANEQQSQDFESRARINVRLWFSSQAHVEQILKLVSFLSPTLNKRDGERFIL